MGRQLSEGRTTERIQVTRKDQLGDTAQTVGMTRKEAFAQDGVWAGTVRTEAGMVSDWHHHGDYDTYAYVLSGGGRFESGPGGRDSVDVGPGDFVKIPAHKIHRESNPGAVESMIALFRVGSGEPLFNVDGPEGW